MTLYIDTKPTLEWGSRLSKRNGCFVHTATHDIIRYDIWERNQPVLKIWVITKTDEICIVDTHYDTLESAKAAAQADYERRTAERFVRVELPERRPAPPYESQYQLGQVSGHNRCLDRLNEIIQTALDRAKEAKDE